MTTSTPLETARTDVCPRGKPVTISRGLWRVYSNAAYIETLPGMTPGQH